MVFKFLLHLLGRIAEHAPVSLITGEQREFFIYADLENPCIGAVNHLLGLHRLSRPERCIDKTLAVFRSGTLRYRICVSLKTCKILSFKVFRPQRKAVEISLEKIRVQTAHVFLHLAVLDSFHTYFHVHVPAQIDERGEKCLVRHIIGYALQK